MLSLPSSVRIFLATRHVDMRKGHYGLLGMVHQFGIDPYSGHLFVFLSRRKDKLKLLTWSEGGFLLLYKRLERGRFKLPALDGSTDTINLGSTQLAMLLDGIDYSKVRRPKLWKPPSAPEPTAP